MTSEEKLAKIMAMRAIRKIISGYVGTVDFHGMMVMFELQDTAELSSGEMEAFLRMKEALRRNDDKTLENDMAECDAFKNVLSEQFDNVLRQLKMSIAG